MTFDDVVAGFRESKWGREMTDRQSEACWAAAAEMLWQIYQSVWGCYDPSTVGVTVVQPRVVTMGVDITSLEFVAELEREAGEIPTLFDVIRIPALRPYKATPPEKRKYTKDGKLFPNDRDRDETPEEFAQRVLDCAGWGEGWSKHFKRYCFNMGGEL